MASALGFVNDKGGKTILASGNNTETINVTLPSQGGTLLTSANGIIPGTIQSFAFSTAPNGWLVCDGSALKRATYVELFAAIGTTFNTGGEAVDEFRIPNMGGQFLRGWVNGQTLDAGRVFGSYQEDTFENHSHNVTDPGHTHTPRGGGAGFVTQGGISQGYGLPVTGGIGWVDTTNNIQCGITIGNSVGGGPETRPKNIAMLFCIFTGLVAQFYTTESSFSDTTPAGVVMHSAAQTPPSGWLACDGSSVSQTTYSALFKAIGTTYGGDATNFNVPDLRGQFLRGWDDGKGVDPGRAFGSSQADGVGPLTLNDPGHVHGVQVTAGSDAGANIAAIGPGDIAGTNTTEPKQTGISFSGNIAETRPKNVALLPIIKI